MVHFSPSVPFKGESFEAIVREIIGGSIGIEGITSYLPKGFTVWPTVPEFKPAIDMISPAKA